METDRLSGPAMREFFNLPPTRDACRERLQVLADEMASIRTQIAVADIRRQAARRALDAQWFHQARTALQTKQQEVADLKAQIKSLSAEVPSGAGREAFKDALIEVVRAHCDGLVWEQLMAQARALHLTRGLHHG